VDLLEGCGGGVTSVPFVWFSFSERASASLGVMGIVRDEEEPLRSKEKKVLPIFEAKVHPEVVYCLFTKMNVQFVQEEGFQKRILLYSCIS
jgi:hypothetical protein